jgi:hypothetical protein
VRPGGRDSRGRNSMSWGCRALITDGEVMTILHSLAVVQSRSAAKYQSNSVGAEQSTAAPAQAAHRLLAPAPHSKATMLEHQLQQLLAVPVPPARRAFEAVFPFGELQPSRCSALWQKRATTCLPLVCCHHIFMQYLQQYGTS